MRVLLISTVICVSTVANLQADVVYSNFRANESFATSSFIVGVYNPTLVQAMPFTVSQDALLSEVRVAVAHVSEFPPNALNVAVYDTNIDGNPGSPLEAMLITDAPSPPPNYGVLSATSILHPRLTAGENYWLVLSSEGRFQWAQTWNDQFGFKFSTDGGVTWKNQSTHPLVGRRSVFSVAGSLVPEPTIFTLLAIVALMFAGIRRR